MKRRIMRMGDFDIVDLPYEEYLRPALGDPFEQPEDQISWMEFFEKMKHEGRKTHS